MHTFSLRNNFIHYKILWIWITSNRALHDFRIYGDFRLFYFFGACGAADLRLRVFRFRLSRHRHVFYRLRRILRYFWFTRFILAQPANTRILCILLLLCNFWYGLWMQWCIDWSYVWVFLIFIDDTVAFLVAQCFWHISKIGCLRRPFLIYKSIYLLWRAIHFLIN